MRVERKEVCLVSWRKPLFSRYNIIIKSYPNKFWNSYPTTTLFTNSHIFMLSHLRCEIIEVKLFLLLQMWFGYFRYIIRHCLHFNDNENFQRKIKEVLYCWCSEYYVKDGYVFMFMQHSILLKAMYFLLSACFGIFQEQN